MKLFDRFICCFIFFFFGFCATAQSLENDITFLKSEGEMPEDLRNLLMHEQKSADQIYLKELLLSGKILYGTTINRYINAIIDQLLLKFPDLKEEVRCYIIRSSEVNAYSTPSGMLFVNLGLLAQITNESELAFILAHEIAHYAEKHTFEKREHKKEKVIKDKRLSYLDYHNRSRELELEADRVAFERYFASSPYSYNMLDGVFDVLQYHYLPFDEVSFHVQSFETKDYLFPENYILPSINPIKTREDYVDTLSTHPNVKRRREYIAQRVDQADDNGRSAFYQPEELFYEIRKTARFECINIFLINQKYADAIYNIYYLQQQYPNNKFLTTAMAFSLYAMAKHKNQFNQPEEFSNYRKVEGEIQQTYFFLHKINRNELSLLAFRHLWGVHLTDPDNEFINKLCYDIMHDVIGLLNMKLSDFSDYPMGTNLEDIVDETAPSDSSKNDNKYERIKRNTQLQKIKPSEKFKTVNYMLVDLKQSPEFLSLFNKITADMEDKEILELVTDKKKRFEVDSILVLNPIYGQSFQDKDIEKMDKTYLEMQKNINRINTVMDYSLRKLKFHSQQFTLPHLKKFTTEEYNIFCKLQQFRAEYYNAGNTKMVLYQCMYMDEVIEKTGFDKMVTIVIYKNKAFFVNFNKIYSGVIVPPICPVMFPIGIGLFFIPRNITYLYFQTVDLSSGKTLFNNVQRTEGDCHRAYSNAYIYDMFDLIKKGK